MLAITPRCAMTAPPTITPAMAETAQLRHWGRHDAQRLALAVAWGRYGEDDARRELATTLAWHAERAKISGISCRALAVGMLGDEVAAIEDRHDTVLRTMTDAAERALRRGDSFRCAAYIAADIARSEKVPPSLIETAMRFAEWRTRRRA